MDTTSIDISTRLRSGDEAVRDTPTGEAFRGVPVTRCSRRTSGSRWPYSETRPGVWPWRSGRRRSTIPPLIEGLGQDPEHVQTWSSAYR